MPCHENRAHLKNQIRFTINPEDKADDVARKFANATTSLMAWYVRRRCGIMGWPFRLQDVKLVSTAILVDDRPTYMGEVTLTSVTPELTEKEIKEYYEAGGK